MLRVDSLAAGYGRGTVLRNIDLGVDAGEIVAVLGRNGVGKTTLMRVLSGAVKTGSGKVQFEGADITNLAPHRRARLGIGYVPQGRAIFSKLTVLENLQVGLYATGGDAAAVARAIEELPLIRDKLSAIGGDLSGGEQQLLALARALIIGPRLLLLDEPSEGIQPSILDGISQLLQRVRERKGTAILIVEQNIDFVAALADRAYLMDRGTISREIARDQLATDRDLHADILGGIDLDAHTANRPS